MLGKTHLALGVASALIITHPATVPGVIAAIAGGGIGGLVADVDCKNKDIDVDIDVDEETEAEHETILNAIINILFMSVFIILDFFIGNGMCQYILDNLGMKIWGSLLCIIILLLIGFNTKHRTFTHSFLGLALFSGSMFYFCRPVAIPFLIGYVSHIIADLFNRRGLQLLFPFKPRFCLSFCYANKSANRALFWTSLAVDIAVGSFLFASAFLGNKDDYEFILWLKNSNLFGLNIVQIYLILINVVTFFGFQGSRKSAWREIEAETNETVRIRLEFGTWILDFLVFIGGGIGMLMSLVLNRAYPSAYNGNWWSFCYAGNLLWFTIYCCICNPFRREVTNIVWLSEKHVPFILYVLGINIISALLLYSLRKRRFSEYSLKHTLVLFFGALGGTIGATLAVIGIHQEKKYHYVSFGFFVMIVSQIIFVMYMMMVGFL